MDISLFLNRVADVAKAAGDLLLSQTVTINHHKSANDLLTENDLQTERYILEEIQKTHPQVTIVSEEYHPDSIPSGISLVVDPIDGTCNYAAGMDLFGIQFAVFENQVCCGAVLYFPTTQMLITAQLGKGAYCNGKLLRIDPQKQASDGILLISDYYPDLAIPMEQQFALVQALQAQFLKTRHMGAACVDFSLMANGHALAYITYYHKIWDIAPGLLVATEAGCVFASLLENTYTYGNPGLVVANNSQTLQAILDTYQKLQP